MKYIHENLREERTSQPVNQLINYMVDRKRLKLLSLDNFMSVLHNLLPMLYSLKLIKNINLSVHEIYLQSCTNMVKHTNKEINVRSLL